MGLRLYFNSKAWENIAKQLRLYSWGISGIAVAAGYSLKSSWVLLANFSAWLILQLAAFVLESVQEQGKERTEK